MKVCVIGASGFVGSHVVDHLRRSDIAVVAVPGPRISSTPASRTEVLPAAREWAESHRQAYERLVRAAAEADAVVNCAGLATPDAPASPALSGANAVLPVVVALAVRESGGTRPYVHVSSAAVQGRRARLDETRHVDESTPYAATKGWAEMALLGLDESSVRVYRATSVQGRERGMTKSLVRYCSLPVVPVPGDGDAPLPLSLVENTAAAIAHLALHVGEGGLYLHPWEGMTVGRMVSMLGQGRSRVLRLPKVACSMGTELAVALGKRSPPIMALAKRLDLLTHGQVIGQSSLAAAGFTPPVGDEGYLALRA